MRYGYKTAHEIREAVKVPLGILGEGLGDSAHTLLEWSVQPMCALSQLEAVSNVRTLMTGIPRAIREHRYLVMLKCYIDDSGSDIQEHGVFVLAGYLMEETRWEDFAERWFVQLNRDFSIDYCKMTEAESGEGQFLGREDIFRKRKVKDLAEVIPELQPYCASVSDALERLQCDL